MLLSRHQFAGRKHDIKVAGKYFENMPQFRYLGMTVTNQNRTQEEIKRRLNSGNAHRERSGFQPYAPAVLYPQEDSWYSILLEGVSQSVRNSLFASP
jgi:hypothetical protein